jgi:Arc/MetJ family transcription regulator
MRTTLDLDDDLMRSLLERHPGVSKREAVERAIREYLHRYAAERLRALRGTLDIEDVSADSRRADLERQERLKEMWGDEG